MIRFFHIRPYDVENKFTCPLSHLFLCQELLAVARYGNLYSRNIIVDRERHPGNALNMSDYDLTA
jgi:hypothetical protein